MKYISNFVHNIDQIKDSTLLTAAAAAAAAAAAVQQQFNNQRNKHTTSTHPAPNLYTRLLVLFLSNGCAPKTNSSDFQGYQSCCISCQRIG
jgi:hypothetical protein